MYSIFFVDDEPLVLESFMSSSVFLECGYCGGGYSINPLDAAQLIEKTNPDAVFTDLKMPGLSGVELTEQLKRGGYCGEVVIISAYGEFEEARRFFKLGGFDYLTKPVSEQELQKLLEKLSEKLSGKLSPETLKTEDPFLPAATVSRELNAIAEYLHKNIALKHSLESISEYFHFNPNYICNLFARHLGTTFVTYMKNIRMEEAAKLLQATQKPVKEIANLCGYKDYFYFCRVFRETYACTPTDYRERPVSSGD